MLPSNRGRASDLHKNSVIFVAPIVNNPNDRIAGDFDLERVVF